MLILYKQSKTMKSIKTLLLTGFIVRTLGITRIYYWFNK